MASLANASNESGFQIEMKTGGTGDFTTFGTTPPNTTVYQALGLSERTLYSFREKATSSNCDSFYSNKASATTFAPPPGTLVATTLSSTQISISWPDVSSNETGFKLERKGGPDTEFSQIAALGANVTRYGDSALAFGTRYTYRVRTSSAVVDSAYSNEKMATPCRASAQISPDSLPTRFITTSSR